MVAWMLACLVAAEALVALEVLFRPWWLAYGYGLVIAVPQAVVLQRLGVRSRTWIPLTALGGCLAAVVAIFVTLASAPGSATPENATSSTYNTAFAVGGLAAGAVLGASQVIVFSAPPVRWSWLVGSVVAGPFVVPLEAWLFGYASGNCGRAFGFDGTCSHVWLSPPLLAAVAGLAYWSLTAPALALLRRNGVRNAAPSRPS